MTTATLPTTGVNLVAFRRFLLALAVAADNYAMRLMWDYENMGGALMDCYRGW